MLEKKNKINKKIGIMLLALSLVLGNAAVVSAKTIKGEISSYNLIYTFKGNYYLSNIVTGSTNINGTKSKYVEVKATAGSKILEHVRDTDDKVSMSKAVGKYNNLHIYNAASRNGATAMACTYY